MKWIGAWLAGVLFALGLGLSGMTDPAKVLAFLDVSVGSDPSLAFVMGGAIGVYFFAARWAAKRTAPLCDTRFHLPARRRVDARLLLGAALFGLGWGAAGYCPGPALVAVTGLNPATLVFVTSMLAAMALVRWLEAVWTPPASEHLSPHDLRSPRPDKDR